MPLLPATAVFLRDRRFNVAQHGCRRLGSRLSALTSAQPLQKIQFAVLVLPELFFPLQSFYFPILFRPLKLLLNSIPHMYSLVFSQAQSHFIVSCSHFLLLCRSLCIISLSSLGFATFSCPGSLANGLNKPLKPVPSFFPFPIHTEQNQFSETLPSPLGAHSSPCPLAEHLIPVTVFLCHLHGQKTLVTGAVTASCASAAGRCPPRRTMRQSTPPNGTARHGPFAPSRH